MMFQSKIPQRYWVEAFYTANFLSNLLPSSALQDKRSPFEILHGKAPDYSSLRSFGCSCYPMLRDYAATKFDPRSLHCVFLGYNDKYKGYRCLYPPTGRVYISRHVLFDESSFPFGSVYSSFHAQATTLSLLAWQKSFLQVDNSAQVETRPKPTSPVVTSNVQISQTSTVAAPAGSLFREEDFLPLTRNVSSSSGTNNSRSVSTGSAPDERTVGSVSVSSTVPISTSQHSMVTRSKSGIVKPNPKYGLLTHRPIQFQQL